MSKVLYGWILSGLLFTQAYALTNCSAPKDPSVTSESCRQIALKLDWLSRYQDHEACKKNLDGLNVYIASQYILAKKYNNAKTLLINAIYQINFAIDIACYGQDDMKTTVKTLNEIIQQL